MKISLLTEKDDRHALSVNCRVEGLSASETKERLADLMTSVDKVLSRERQEESETLPIRRGVCF
jgi:hypothetical protein